MGLFDALAKQALGGFFGGGSQPADLLSSLLNQAGGLSGLMQRFEQAGMTEVFASWVSTGENQPVQPSQVEQVLGAESISMLAGRLGLDRNMILPLLSQFLPQVIDQLTPQGTLEGVNPSGEQLQNVLAGVVKRGLGSLLGGRA